jgi:uncharacterized YigZ family protein
MLFSHSYYTIAEATEAQHKDRGSKFIACAFPVKSELEIKEQLLLLRKNHPSANHHCYAWRLGADKSAFRANDDGEPANTAGKPILAQIQAKDLTNILVVVVRYFGGTLLGVGGLIQAYKTAAAEVLNQARIEERFILYEYSIVFPYAVISEVMRCLKEYEAKIISATYETENRIVFQVKKVHAESVENRFAELYTTRLDFLRLA